MPVTKKEIADNISKKSGVPQSVVRQIIDFFLEEIKNIFKANKKIELRGFGTFFPHFKRARKYKDPRSGEEKEMPGRNTLKFKASKQLFIFKNGKKH